MRESGIQAAEAIVAGGAAGAASAVRSVSENQTMLALRGGGDWLDRTLRIPRRLAPPRVEPLLERAGQRAAEVERVESFASQQLAEAEASEGFATAAEAAAGAAEAAAAAEGGGMLAALGEGALAAAGTVGAATGGLAVAGAGAAWAIEGGLNAASHLMGWGAATGGGTDSDASRPSRATDVQTLNSMQESGAVDHFQVQEMRRQQRPEVFRIDTSEEEPQAQPRQQIRARPIRRQGRAAAHALRHQPGAHPGELRQRPHQPPVPKRPGAFGHPGLSTPLRAAVLRRPSSGERT